MPSLHRPRVLSLNFFNRDNSGSTSSNGPMALKKTDSANSSTRDLPPKEPASPVVHDDTPTVTPPRTRAGTTESRPASMMYPYTPPTLNSDHIEELLPVFSFLSSHSNKLYQEGYFLKLNDLDSNGKPNADRNWTECFAQLVGTVLSLWDAAALDAAGQDGEVAPTFVNLADASIKMIQTLPTRNADVQPLQNVLSISTAGKNRYLLHFNSLHSLTQWTAGIRLSMFEHASLQELYTGSLIAGKGKHLNNIKTIMERSRFRTEDWARVRFGAGTPWRRCWCVIEPPDEKEIQKQTKSLKKRSAYERPQQPKGDIKFYETKKTKKAVPIATITDAYSAYAIYPQSKPLIDQSTLVKVEGKITIHSNPESKTEGFVFVMPEVHPAVSGFEMMLRWLFPVYDIFCLYGRPSRLIADTLDTRGLMFAMPKERRYGYLDIIDVAGLIHTDGSEKWSEREWRKQMKDITSRRMQGQAQSRDNSTFPRNHRASMGSGNGLRYENQGSIRSTPSTRLRKNQSTDTVFATPKKSDTAPNIGPFPIPNNHHRSVSESVAIRSPIKSRRNQDGYQPSRMSMDPETNEDMGIEGPPLPPTFRPQHRNGRQNGLEFVDSRESSENEFQAPHTYAEDVNRDMGESTPPAPVVAPPTMQHEAGDRPRTRPNAMPDLRREKSRMSTATLAQLSEVSRMNNAAAAGATAAWKTRDGIQAGDSAPRGVNQTPDNKDNGMPADQKSIQGLVVGAPSNELKPPKGTDPKSRASSGHSISRKPLPRTASAHSVGRSQSPMPPIPLSHNSAVLSANMYSNYLVPSAAILKKDPSPDRTSQHSNPFRDPDSTDPRDYTRSNPLRNTRQLDDYSERPRTGVLKIVGNPDIYEGASAVSKEIPDIDFGPTQRLTPNSSRPTTPHGLPDGRKSAFDSSPVDSMTAAVGVHSRNTSSSSSAERFIQHSRSQSYLERSVAWQPGAKIGTGRSSPSPGLTPEEYVQQRAAAARLPTGYAPKRNHSSGNIERPVSDSKRDSFIRSFSGNSQPNMMQQMQHPDYSSRLSAREQEHVSKMTGSPLVNTTNRSRVPDPSVGLIGAIEAREQEKRNMKEGVSGQMVQAAIAQRQQHVNAQMHAQTAAQTAYGYQVQQQQHPTNLVQDPYGRSNSHGQRTAPAPQYGQRFQDQWPQQQQLGQGQWPQQQQRQQQQRGQGHGQ